MEKKIINTDKAPAAVGPYVQAIQKGNMLYASGQLGLVPETGVLAEGVQAQTKQSLANTGSFGRGRIRKRGCCKDHRISGGYS